MGVSINKKSTTTEPPPQNGQQPMPPWGLNAFYWYQIFAPDSAAAEVQDMSAAAEVLEIQFTNCVETETGLLLVRTLF